ncbi:MAG: NAD(P)H-dependent glycerol-3-phosphate dehydrogenase, partial [Mobilitalea sp.]
LLYYLQDQDRVYTSPDIIGIELGGSLKNVIALAAGIVDGLGLGDNTKAALMTRGMAEISRLGMIMGGKMETFAGLSGFGDLFVTCTSVHSRNWNAGNLMGQGKTMEEAMKQVNQVVEGVNSAKAALALAQKNNVEMPIVEQINLVLFEGKTAKEALNDLLLRDKRKEYKTLEWD